MIGRSGLIALMPLLTAACASSAAAPSLAPVETPPPLEATLAPGDHAVTVHALGASLERAYFARPFWCPAAETLPYDAERERAALCVDTVRVLLVPLPTLGAVRENFNYPRLERHLPSYPHVAITPEGPAIIELNDNPFHTLYQLSHGRGVLNPDFAPVFDRVAEVSAKMLEDRKARQKARKDQHKRS